MDSTKELLRTYLKEFNKSQAQAIADKLKIQRDQELEQILNKLKSQGTNYQDLKDKLGSEIKTIEDLKAFTTVSKRDAEKQAQKDAPIVFKNENWFVVRPETRAASCKYGKETKWCTAGDTNNQFNRYRFGGVTLYYIIDRTLTQPREYSKLAVAVAEIKGKLKFECFKSNDRRVTFEKVLNLSNIPKSVFKVVEHEGSDADIMLSSIDNLKEVAPGIYDLEGSATLRLPFKSQKLPVKIRNVKGNFNILSPSNLNSFENFPDKINGNFDSYIDFKQRSLEGLHTNFGGNVGFTSWKSLKSLSGLQDRIYGDLYIVNTGLNSLEGAPKYVDGDVFIIRTKIKSLKGFPEVRPNARIRICDNLLTTFDIPIPDCDSLDLSPNPLGPEIFDLFFEQKPKIKDVAFPISLRSYREQMSKKFKDDLNIDIRFY